MVHGRLDDSALPRPRLEVDGVTLQYRTRDYAVRATQRVSFDVHGADRFVLLGPSGCGKSSLLKAIAGFLSPVEGEIRLDGQKVTEPGPDRMMVFQEFDQLLPWKTVEQNVLFPMERTGKYSGKDARERARRFLDKVKLSKFAHVYPHQLSGGMKQRVAIARALALEPRVLLMDEPFAALDALTRREMQQELLQLWDEARFTVVFVTHSIHEAIVVGNRILVLSPHPGRVKAELNSGDFGEGAEAGMAIQALDTRINAMLFGEAAGASTGQSQAGSVHGGH
ncbi:MAG: hypothetical protein A4S15_12100 [Candidatus Raskinella chloraquaticus]|uniref:ABC transporter domain-containing protein n=1 Tax=Candidatus Raskinella chloraquaticus TaxID=1951219 RepID=A0A1W9HVC2_9HYPH|nr:MAG: hypothetical protein A4S15_12100 [Proteobacteria bacterium SG_bin8]